MKIGEVAKLSGTGIETIRFYAKQRLLAESDRRPSGYRLFSQATVDRLLYIRRAKELGFTLAEIRDLLELSATHSDCEHVRQRAEAKVGDIERKIRTLREMKRSLSEIVERCRKTDSTEDCPLVHKTKPGPAG